MKNINWKNIIKGVSAGALLLTLFVVGQNMTFAQPLTFAELTRNNRFLGQSGNTQPEQVGLLDLTRFQLAPNVSNSQIIISDSDFTNFNSFLGSSLLFRQYGTAIFDNIAAYGDVAVRFLNAGFGTIQSETPDSAKLKVNGEIKIESFADGDPYDSRLRQLCTNDFGVLEVCGGVIDTVSPNAINGVCVNYPGEYANQPATDTASGCVSGTFVDVLNVQTDTVHRWACYGSNGGITAECTANQTITLDPVDLGVTASRNQTLTDKIIALFSANKAEASSSICSERDNLNDNGVYKKSGSAYVRFADKLSFIIDNAGDKNIDYSALKELGLYSTKQVAIYTDTNAQTLLPDGEYLISGDSVINELRDPLQSDDGILIPSGTPVSAVALVVQSGQYSFQTCDETAYLTDDQIRDKDIAAIQTELEKYYDKNGRYPKTSSTGATEPNSAWANSASSSWQKVADTLGLVTLPVDPKNEVEDKATSWTGDQRYALYVDETYGGCNNGGQSYILIARFDDQSVVSPGAPTCDNGRNYFKKTVGECKDPACNASWYTSPWGTCSNGTQIRTVECRGSDGQKTRVTKPCETQNGPAPADSQSCASPAICANFASSYESEPATSSNGCSVGNYTNISDTATSWRWQCNGLNGGSNASCSATRTTYSWQVGSWGTCNTANGTQSRTVACQASTGGTVSDSLCSGTKPSLTQSCSVAGSCKTFNSTYANQPATNSTVGCNNGTYSDISDTTGDFRWQCTGLNGGATQTCSASKINKNPISEYRFDACEYTGLGNEIIDSISGINGRIVGSTSTTDENSKIGRSLLTDGETGYTIIPNNSKHSFSERMSFSFWMNPKERPDGYAAHILDKWSGTGNANYVMYYFGTGSIRVYANVNGSWASPSSSYVPALNTWTHVAWTYDSEEGGQLYINGSPVGGKAGKGPLTTNNLDVNISHPGYNGLMDEVKIYGDRLSPQMIQDIYESEISRVRTIDCLSNDQKRERDIADIKALLEDYYNKNGQYPQSAGSIEPNSGWENSGSSQWDSLATTLGVAKLPTDPINEVDGPAGNWSNEYRYYYYSRGYGCGGQWYMLYHKSEDNPSTTVGNVRSCSQIFTYGGMIGTGECKSEFCNASWQSSSWGTCTNGTQTRTVQCVGDKGTPTSDANCKYAGVKPATSQSCASAGVCNTSYTGNYTSQPATSTATACIAGTYSDQPDGPNDQQWNWQCLGYNGGATANCGAKYLQNGQCGASNSGTYSSTPTFSCGFSQSPNVTDSTAADGTWNWTCPGVNGGSTVSCSANYRQNAVCESYPESYGSEPAVDSKTACSIGTFSDTPDTTTKWNWNCTGINGGANASCSATRTTYSWQVGSWGTCNTANGTQSRTVACQASTGGTVSDSLCSGTKPATSQSCAVAATCASFTGNYTTQPAKDTKTGCVTGTYTNTSNGLTSFNWSCNGLNGGSSALCSANWQRAGLCKSYTGTYNSQPATNTSAGCAIGNYTNVSNTSSSWRWSCSGVNGGSATTCSANTGYYWSSGSWGTCNITTGTQSRTVRCLSYATSGTVSDSLCSTTKPTTSQSCTIAGKCNTGYTGEYATQPATDTKTGCTQGSYLNGPDTSTFWNWSCRGLNSGSDDFCSASRTNLGVDGSCKVYTSKYSLQPATDTKSGCVAGTYLDIDDGKSPTLWTWQCRGVDGGKSASCSAQVDSGGGPVISEEGGSCDPEKSCCYLDSKNNWVEGPPCL